MEMKGRNSDSFYQVGANSPVAEGLPLREYTYDTGTEGQIEYFDSVTNTKYDSFREFAIKIVGYSDNSATPPVIQNLRAIAVT